jgi:hypothetical protein
MSMRARAAVVAGTVKLARTVRFFGLTRSGVTTVAVGDHVAVSFVPSCGRCRWCSTGRAYICDEGAKLFDIGMMSDGREAHHLTSADGGRRPVFLRDTASKLGLPYPYVPMAIPPEFAAQYDGKVWIQYGHTVTALAFMPAMLAMARNGDWWANRMLSWKPLRFLGRMSYTVYVWHTFFYFIVLDALGGNEFLGEKWRAPILAVIAVVASLPIFYGVEQRMLRVKLRFAAEKEVLDLNTGKMISVEAALAAGHGTVSAEAVEARRLAVMERGRARAG